MPKKISVGSSGSFKPLGSVVIKSKRRFFWLSMSSFMVLFAAVGVYLLLSSRADAPTENWTWYQSNIHGGGTPNVVQVDPTNSNNLIVGGDSWGIYASTNGGSDWFPTMKGMAKAGTSEGKGSDGSTLKTNSQYFISSMAYSRKYPGRVYSVSGRLSEPGKGIFGYVSGNSFTTMSTTVNTGEPLAGGAEKVRPRAIGNRLLLNYDTASGTEYIYVAQGNGKGIARTTDGGSTWTTLTPDGFFNGKVITGMSFDPASNDVLYIGTSGDKAYRMASVSTASAGQSTPSQLSSAPPKVEEMAVIGGNLYAVANASGAYKVTDNGATWTHLNIPGLSNQFYLAAIGGSGNTIYVGGAYSESASASTMAGKTLAKSTDGGANWTWLATAKSQINYKVLGSGETANWWLYTAAPRVALGCLDGGCGYETTYIAVDQLNPNNVYLAARAGFWKSTDGGATWQVAVNHMAATMHSVIVGSGDANASIDDEDWKTESTADAFNSIMQSDTPGAALRAHSIGTINYNKTFFDGTTHNYQVGLTSPRTFSVDGRSVDDEFFRAAVVRPTDIYVSDDGNYVYITQYGGGVIIGHRTYSASTRSATVADTIPPTISGLTVSSASPVAGNTVTFGIQASDDSGIQKAELWEGSTYYGQATRSGGGYVLTWKTTAAVVGTHHFTAKVYDNSSNHNLATQTIDVQVRASGSTPTPTPTVHPTATATATARPTATPTTTPRPTATATPRPTVTPVPTPAPDTTKPIVAVSWPFNDMDKISGKKNIAISATDSQSGVKNITIKVKKADGTVTTLTSTVSGSSTTYVLDTTKLANNGSNNPYFSFEVFATDNAGNQSSTASRKFVVRN